MNLVGSMDTGIVPVGGGEIATNLQPWAQNGNLNETLGDRPRANTAVKDIYQVLKGIELRSIK